MVWGWPLPCDKIVTLTCTLLRQMQKECLNHCIISVPRSKKRRFATADSSESLAAIAPRERSQGFAFPLRDRLHDRLPSIQFEDCDGTIDYKQNMRICLPSEKVWHANLAARQHRQAELRRDRQIREFRQVQFAA